MTKTKIKTQDFLSKLALFNDMGPQELDRIASGTSEMHVQRGETLFQRGDICTGFHAVIYGQVKLAFTSSQGSEKIVEIIGPGHSFGEAIMFMDKPYIVAAQALNDTLLLHISKSAVLAELESDPLFARKMLAGLSRRLHGLICDVEAYSLCSGTQRVIGYLLQHGTDTETQIDGLKIILPFSKAVLASRLNLTPEHFSRILHDLTENQLINVSGKNITILNIEKLRNYEG
ncbi:MAG: Crp/Fnr family transcriptional regulator [Burkholderiaceae bacterium]